MQMRKIARTCKRQSRRFERVWQLFNLGYVPEKGRIRSPQPRRARNFMIMKMHENGLTCHQPVGDAT